MKDNKLTQLLEKLQTKTIRKEELEALKELLQHRKSSIQESIKLQQHYEHLRQEKEELPPYKNQENTKNRLLSSLHQESNKKNKRPISKAQRLIWGSVAISLLVATFFIHRYKPSVTPSPQLITISSSPGVRKKITLPDQTIILLNGNSKIMYPSTFSTYSRRILLEGEAFFEVTAAADKPFYVVTADFTTEVLGTSFSIDSDLKNSIEVSSGKVQVYAVDSASSNRHILNLKKERPYQQLVGLEASTATLAAGQRAQLSSSIDWEISSNSDSDWQKYELHYYQEPLKNVVKSALRNYGDTIRIPPSLAEMPITITFNHKSSAQLALTLAELANATIRQDKNSKTWIMKAKK